MRHVLFFAFAVFILTGCGNQQQQEIVLLPKPQKMTIHQQKHRLLEGEIDEDKIQINFVESVDGAEINRNEAYKLTITPESVIIDAVTDKGVYWAKQTLDQ